MNERGLGFIPPEGREVSLPLPKPGKGFIPSERRSFPISPPKSSPAIIKRGDRAPRSPVIKEGILERFRKSQETPPQTSLPEIEKIDLREMPPEFWRWVITRRTPVIDGYGTGFIPPEWSRALKQLQEEGWRGFPWRRSRRIDVRIQGNE